MNKKNKDKILNRIVALTKEINLSKIDDNIGIVSKFIADKNFSENALFGFGINWWYTKKSLTIIDSISSMILRYDKTLQYGDVEKFSSLIMRALQTHALDDNLFSFRLCNKKGLTLFDIRSNPDVSVFSLKVWEVIRMYLKKHVTKWLIAYPIQGIISESFEILNENIFIMNPNDSEKWETISSGFSGVDDWDPKTCKNTDSGPLLNIKTSFTWMFCVIEGTELGARKTASLKMRKFIAILFAHLKEKHPFCLQKSMRGIINYCIQFPSNLKKVGFSQQISNIGQLVFPLGLDIQLDQDAISRILQWYDKIEKIEEDSLHRINKASHFANYAMVSSGIERFIFFFIVLDALFGERNSVENSIIQGVREILSNCPEIKISELFELRSELVHGGASYIEEWSKYEHYKKTYNKSPNIDIEDIALKCLEGFPKTQ